MRPKTNTFGISFSSETFSPCKDFFYTAPLFYKNVTVIFFSERFFSWRAVSFPGGYWYKYCMIFCVLDVHLENKYLRL